MVDSDPDTWSVPEMFVDSSAGDVKGGVEERGISGWSVLGTVSLSSGVESDVSSDVEMYSCWVTLGCPFELWVPLGPPALPVSENTQLKEPVMCWSVVSLVSALVDWALRV